MPQGAGLGGTGRDLLAAPLIASPPSVGTRTVASAAAVAESCTTANLGIVPVVPPLLPAKVWKAVTQQGRIGPLGSAGSGRAGPLGSATAGAGRRRPPATAARRPPRVGRAGDDGTAPC